MNTDPHNVYSRRQMPHSRNYHFTIERVDKINSQWERETIGYRVKGIARCGSQPDSILLPDLESAKKYVRLWPSGNAIGQVSHKPVLTMAFESGEWKETSHEKTDHE